MHEERPAGRSWYFGRRWVFALRRDAHCGELAQRLCIRLSRDTAFRDDRGDVSIWGDIERGILYGYTVRRDLLAGQMGHFPRRALLDGNPAAIGRFQIHG